MEQEYFSRHVINFFSEKYPEFIPTIKFHKDGSFDCDSKSPTGLFSIWIATYNSEITFGVETPDGKTDIHIHFRCDEVESIHECFEDLSLMINDIKENKLIVYRKDSSTYDWIGYSSIIELEQKSGTTLEKYFWS